jgi:hypothetical protein
MAKEIGVCFLRCFDGETAAHYAENQLRDSRAGRTGPKRFSQLANLGRINALEPGLEILNLLPQRDVGGAELIQLGLVGNATLDIENPSQIALDAERKLLIMNIFLRLDSETQCQFGRSSLTI